MIVTESGLEMGAGQRRRVRGQEHDIILAAPCLGEPRVEKVRVRVEKPGAVRFSWTVGVKIEREKGNRA